MSGPSTPTTFRAACRRISSVGDPVPSRPVNRRHHLPLTTDARLTSRPGRGPRRLDEAVYRRRRRLTGIAIAIAVAALSLGAQAALTGPGGGPGIALLFTPWVCVPLATWCVVQVVRWSGPSRQLRTGSGGGGQHPALLAPAA